MIQYYLDLEKQVKTIKETRLSQGQIQKIYSTAFFISMAIRTPGKTWHLYLGRGAGQEGLWLHDAAPLSALRKKDNFLEYMRRHLSSCSFIDVDLDSRDRIVAIRYQKFGEVQSLLLFWKGRKLYFLHHYQDQPEAPFKLLLSWRGKAITLNTDVMDLYDYFDEIGRLKNLKHDLSSHQNLSIEQLLQDELNSSSLKSLGVKPDFLERKKQNIEDDLRRTKQWERLQNILDKDEPLDNLYELKVGDHNIKFEGPLNPYERRNIVYEKIKKLKRGEGILAKRLEVVNEQLAGVNKAPELKSSLPIVKPVWGKDEMNDKKTIVSPSQQNDFRVFEKDGYQIAVGLSSQGNDQLRNRWGSKDDMWLHLDGSKSSHVIIKSSRQTLPETDILNFAASILAYFSRFESEWIPVIYTQVKNLKGVTGAPGMVIYKKEKHLRCPRINLDDWLKD